MVITNERVVLPGDRAEEAETTAKAKKVILGPGLRRQDDKVIVCKAGTLKMRPPNTYWVDSYQKRYVPNRGELIIGCIVQKSGDIFRVDIGSSDTACLSYLAFESATKKYRPDVNIGDIIYGKLIVANKDYESELVCVDSMGKKGKLGVLHGGFVFNCSINLVRKILNDNCPLLKSIEREMQIPMEIVIGMNGKIWIKTKNVKDCIAIGNAILATEHIPNEDIPKLCDNISCLFSGFV